MNNCNNCIHKEICNEWEKRTEYVKPVSNGACEHYADATEMVKLPCKVGDTVYVLMQRNVTTDIVKGTVRNVRRHSDNTWWLEFSDLWVDKTFDDFGKTVFLTQKEAEQALKGGNENA